MTPAQLRARPAAPRHGAAFVLVSSSAHCCHPKELRKRGRNHSQTLWKTANGYSYRPHACMPLCRSTTGCRHFSHSK
eukprot:856537-Prymnesium_polylepis.1